MSTNRREPKQTRAERVSNVVSEKIEDTKKEGIVEEKPTEEKKKEKTTDQAFLGLLSGLVNAISKSEPETKEGHFNQSVFKTQGNLNIYVKCKQKKKKTKKNR